MKEHILQTIYDTFAAWAQPQQSACDKRCSACCSQNVTITGLEGEQILKHVLEHGQEEWLARKLLTGNAPHRPATTTNGFASACLRGQEVALEEQTTLTPCPFLEDNVCTIYPARPFGCRSFLSRTRCSPSQPALVPDAYVVASTVVSQLIEHLGQGEYWGNMLDVLAALLDISAYREIAQQLDNPAFIAQARLHTLRAQPLPGFLLTEEDHDQVAPLLTAIFSAQIDGKTLEDILNGR